jgi:hypothetical protein
MQGLQIWLVSVTHMARCIKVHLDITLERASRYPGVRMSPTDPCCAIVMKVAAPRRFKYCTSS